MLVDIAKAPYKVKRYEGEIPDNIIKYLVTGINDEIKFCSQFWLDCHLRLCQSPIEMLMLIGLYRYIIASIPKVFITEVVPQCPAGPYKIDLAVGINYEGNNYKIAIECDGHDYHEKTEAQARHDKKRDRYLQSQGWLVARFTGKEINQDPRKCAEQAIEMVMDYSVEVELNGY